MRSFESVADDGFKAQVRINTCFLFKYILSQHIESWQFFLNIHIQKWTLKKSPKNERNSFICGSGIQTSISCLFCCGDMLHTPLYSKILNKIL